MPPAIANLIETTTPESCCNDAWEQAYRRFESPEQEVAKFMTRLKRLGAPDWDPDGRMVELFCGRGNGLVALERLGFHNLQGVDLSKRLLEEYRGPAQCFVADCRSLPLETGSCDAVIIQGGLHHLPNLPVDLEQVASEMHRVLKAGGQVVIVEPWDTPFLRVVHGICRRKLIRRLSSKVDALATMIDHERDTYENWLQRPAELLEVLCHRFESMTCRTRWGKLEFVGRKR